MAHFAKLDQNNVVIEVLALNNDIINNLPFPESEPIGVDFFMQWSGGYMNWKQTSYNSNFRKNYAGIGYIYDSFLDAFIPPQPFPSWTLNKDMTQWEAPIPYPNEVKPYTWDEQTLAWVEEAGA